MELYDGIDLTRLFDNESKYGKRYRFADINDSLIRRAEEKIGYKLPASYRELLTFQNGGRINRELDESWLTSIYGICPESDSNYSLDGMYDNWRNEWEYPDIGIPFGETQSAGHDMYYMDYRSVDKNGEPRIVRIDNDDPDNINIYYVADNLVDFIKLILRNTEIEETLLS